MRRTIKAHYLPWISDHHVRLGSKAGGLRGQKPDAPRDVNAFWQNQSFHNYADYAMSESSHDGTLFYFIAPTVNPATKRSTKRL
jgi:hypothetical protein